MLHSEIDKKKFYYSKIILMNVKDKKKTLAVQIGFLSKILNTKDIFQIKNTFF